LGGTGYSREVQLEDTGYSWEVLGTVRRYWVCSWKVLGTVRRYWVQLEGTRYSWKVQGTVERYMVQLGGTLQGTVE
jgi:hypothetical protein